MSELFTAPARQAASVRETGHRPWPLPTRTWFMGQSWLDLLFAHWPVDHAAVEPHVPSELALDRFDGRAWVGVTPFVVTALRMTATPPLPFLSSFPELNVRTYVSYRGKPGIWFFSLDAASRVAVGMARRFYRLPYFLARMDAKRDRDGVSYESTRTDRRGHAARFAAEYGPSGPVRTPVAGSLEHFLTERYCLYTIDRGRVLHAEIHHPPWPLQPADAEIRFNAMPPPGLELPQVNPLLHYAARQDVVIWRLAPAAG